MKIYTQNQEVKKIDFKELSKMEREIEKLIDIDFESMSGDEYFNFNDYLNDLLAMQQEDGSFPLAIDPSMPSDCRYWYVKRVTVIILKVLCEYDNPIHYDAIQKAANYLAKVSLVGHGYEGYGEAVLNLTMLIKTNVLSHVNQEFCNMVNELIQNVRRTVLERAKKGMLNKCESSLELLALIDNDKFIFYGSLNEEKIREAIIENYKTVGRLSLKNVGVEINMGYPTLVELPGKTTVCFLYQVDCNDIEVLDEYEGKHYSKIKLLVETNNTAYFANTYVREDSKAFLDMNKIK